ncbi:MAG TPA: DUF1501 domain-containing protein [Terriglobia bacterium]|jgi:uncharacterized protein (DUF1501 family)
MLTRRCFIRSSAVAVAGAGLAPSWLRAASQETKKKKILIAIFQRGAADGLNIVVPYFEQPYYDLRPGIAIPAPGSGRPNSAIDLDGRFGLHPQLQQLKPLWDSKQLAIVEATGSPDPSRSHFEAQDYMEAGIPGNAAGDGWLNRAMQPEPGASTLRAIAVGAQLPRTLRGNWPAVAVNNLDQFKVHDQNSADILQAMYATTPDAKLHASGKETFEAVKMVDAINQKPYAPANGAQYNNEFGRGLQQIARLIKADAGVEAAFADIGGWDHHSNEPGQLNGLLQQYGSALAAFVRDMGDRMDDIVLVTMSEFGRTVKEDGNNGTDHGHGNVMMVLGGPVRGGHIYGRWPGLAPDQLYENRDLAVTTDFRDVLGELVQKHLGQSTDKVFPGYKPGPALGLI